MGSSDNLKEECEGSYGKHTLYTCIKISKNKNIFFKKIVSLYMIKLCLLSHEKLNMLQFSQT